MVTAQPRVLHRRSRDADSSVSGEPELVATYVFGNSRSVLTASDTAFSIAAVRADEGLRPAHERLFDDPYAHLFRALGARAEEGTKRYLDLPFFRDGIRLRTRFIDDVLRNALDDELDQIMLLGAGFDARSLRIPEIAARRARVYEIDLADQLRRKRDAFAAASVTLPAWVSYIPCDLTAPDYETTLTRALDDAGFEQSRPALVIWEGVTTYIGVAATDRSLRFMARLVAPGSQVVFDVGTSFFPSPIREHVANAGFSSCESHGADELWRRYLPGEPHPGAAMFRMVVAHR
jgi:methyltransferase (TIGR00027 family)